MNALNMGMLGNSWSIRLAGVTAAYFVAGRLALLLAIPPGYATPVWPAAGIGLAAILIFGYRIWPGILLGSFLVNSGVSLDPTNGFTISKSLMIGISIGFGAAVQAVIGVHLIKRFIGYPTALDDGKAILKFLLIGGPIACLANATWGVATLWVSGTIRVSDSLFHWWTWWIGDSMGVLVFTPLILLWIGEPRQAWEHRRVPVGIPLTISFILAVISFTVVSRWEQERIDLNLRQHASSLSQGIERNIDQYLEVLHSIGRFYSNEQFSDRKRFKTFVSPSLSRHQGIHALEWIPRVLDEEREAYESSARNDGFLNFQFTEKGPQGNLIPALRRDEYFPVYFVEPVSGNERALGFDLGSDVSRLEALSRAADTGQPIATEPIALNQESGEGRGFLVIQPTYRRGEVPDEINERRQEFVGYVLGVFRVADLIHDALSILDPKKIDLEIYDSTESRNPMQIFSSLQEGQPYNEEGWAVQLEFAGRQWSLKFARSKAFLLESQSLWMWSILVSGFFITGLLSAFMLLITGRTVRIESVVAERTDELARANAALELEVMERKRSEKILRIIMEGTSIAVGEHFFQALMRQLATALDVKWAFISELTDATQRRLRIIALWEGGDYRDPFEYEAKDTPSEGVFSSGDQCYVQKVQEAFPKDSWLRENNVESYLAIGLFDTLGQPLGHMGVMDTKPLDQESLGRSILSIFASRAGSELERRRGEDRLNYLAHHDPLTSLPNRMLFFDRLNQAISRVSWHKRFVAVIFLDLDFFKRINDSLGHTIGDVLLKEVSKRMFQSVRRGDTISRLGGDEFAIILADLARLEDVPKVVQKITQALSKPFMIEGHELFVTTSIGISVYPDDGQDAERLLKNADIAMYRAKESGRNTYQHYSVAMESKAFERLAIESSLRHSIERSEFTLHFQPIVSADDHEIIAMEALIRWQHPTLGTVPPGKFIPLAEEIGLIVQLGEWVLREACRQGRIWKDAGLGAIPVAVNISARQFKEKNLTQVVEGILDETGLSGEFLELELTETIMQDPENAIKIMARLKEKGVRFSIDDFGTGYSSLSYLKRFPLDILKIDQSFVRDITAGADHVAIVNGIISLAHSIKLKAIAEGVETREQLDLLTSMKCDGLQGYIFGRPLPVHESTRLLVQRTISLHN